MTQKDKKLVSKNANELSDEELIVAFKCGDTSALAILFERYRKIADLDGKFEKKFNKAPGLTSDDYVTVFLESFYPAVNNFDAAKGNFRSYWRRISHNGIIKMLAENNHYYAHVAYSLDSEFDEERELKYEDIVGEIEENPLYKGDDETLGLYVAEFGIKLLDPMEEEIIAARMFGETYANIAKKLNISMGDARYRFLRAKEKLKKSALINAFIKKHYFDK